MALEVPEWLLKSNVLERVPWRALTIARRPGRWIGYGIAGAIITGIIASILAPPVGLMLWLLSFPDEVRPFVGMSFFVLPYIGGLIVVRYYALDRMIKKFRARCLNCGQLRDPGRSGCCIGCGSRLDEQDMFISCYSDPAAGRRRLDYRALHAHPRHLDGWRRLSILGLAVLMTAIVGFFMVVFLEESLRPVQMANDTFRCAVGITLVVVCMTCAAAIGHYQGLRHKFNYSRLNGLCLECETPYTSDVLFCPACRRSIVRQLRYRAYRTRMATSESFVKH